MKTTKYSTREQWLLAGLELLKPIFSENGFKVPTKIRVSCGFPSKNPLGNKKRRIGECWADKASQGKYFEIFISPVLSNPYAALDTLLHEMIHATVGLECGHQGAFRSCAKTIGMEGKMTQCCAGPGLKDRINGYLKKLGPYPHDQLDKMTNGKKKDHCRLLKAECSSCGYVIRTTRKWLEVGLPTCVCGSEFEADNHEELENEGE